MLLQETYPECDLDCARALETTIKAGSNRDVAAFMMEPVMGHGGHILPPDEEYFKIIRETFDEHDIVFIVDEVQTAPARTGRMFAYQTFGFKPDVICVGKGFGGGLPFGAAIFREDLLPPNFTKAVWSHTITNTGQPVLMSAASAVIDVVLEEKLTERAAKMGNLVTRAYSQCSGIIG